MPGREGEMQGEQFAAVQGGELAGVRPSWAAIDTILDAVFIDEDGKHETPSQMPNAPRGNGRLLDELKVAGFGAWGAWALERSRRSAA